MLHLQRASAGSGKTYTLAYTFIRDFITAFDNGKRVLIRSERRLADSLTHILAITFTNKATNEMKIRIVESLAALADTSLPADKVAYLKELTRELNVSRKQLAETCAKALGIMLNNYSDLHISTIDSFFQSVLRTFAYETDLNESYQVEIDTDYVDRAAIDAVLEQVNNSQGSDPEAEFWIRVLMNRGSDKGNQWNVFQRSDAKRSIYTSILNMMKELDSEDFRNIKDKLDNYFEQNPDLRSVYTSLEKHYNDINAELIQIREKARNEATDLLDSLPADTLGKLKTSLLNSLGAISGINDKATPAKIKLSGYNPEKGWPRVMDTKKGARKAADLSQDNHIGDMVQVIYDTVVEYNSLLTSSFRVFWDIYRINFPYLGLLQRVGLKKKDFLEANNLMQLGDTTTILSRIIGDDDTPFIYERLGTRLEHYLIDEFQDTSAMQWQLLSPLVHESHDKGFDNLIIGDAKQSIYRFRNADYSLITDKVPSEFDPVSVYLSGMELAENTNWRSEYRIVMWNNVVFNALANRLQDRIKSTEVDLIDIYRNVAQPVSPKKADHPAGYIELRVFNTISSADNTAADDADSDSDTIPTVLTHIPSLIRSLMSRGYRQRDIAVLVRGNKTGQEVIEQLISDNSAHQELPPIEFISEQSLLVGNSKAVRVVISALESIARGTTTADNCKTDVMPQASDETDNTDEQTDKKKNNERGVSWQEIKADFALYTLQHPEMTPANRLQSFLNIERTERPTDEIIAKMQAVALPALIEALIENFVEPSLRRSHTPFLAALQDMVTDYCQRFPTDIISFLGWWNKEGSRKSISSPDGVDAVQIMTLHKAKGLEFPCVIMPEPEIALSMRPNSGTVWLQPLNIHLDGIKLPPRLPVTINRSLTDVDTSGIYDRLCDLTVLDAINMGYVAFTRAVRELYILAACDYKINDGTLKKSTSGKNASSLARYLIDICDNFDTCINELQEATGLKADLSLEITDEGTVAAGMTDSEGNNVPAIRTYRFGEQTSPAIPEKNVGNNENKDEDKNKKENLPIEDYRVNSEPVVLQYSEPKVSVTDNADNPEADSDPRSLGNLMHTVMAEIIRAEDLDTALRRLKVKGLIDSRNVTHVREILSAAIERAPIEWFDGSMRVMNERPLITGGRPEYRPDRIMVTSDHRCIVVDYKFGLPGGASDATLQSYRNQVTRYARLLASTGLYSTVEAWLWHVPYSDPVSIPLKSNRR